MIWVTGVPGIWFLGQFYGMGNLRRIHKGFGMRFGLGRSWRVMPSKPS